MSKDFYNYYLAMNDDIRDYIRENYTEEEIREKLEDRDEWETELNDDLWTEDSVTGNASGSYTFNRWKARENVIENLDLLSETLHEFGEDGETIARLFLNEEWENFDVKIRCYILGSVIYQVLDEIEEELEEEEIA